MALQDINCSRAHAQMLGSVGVLTSADVTKILQGLDEIAAEVSDGTFEWSVELEDVHMNIEARLTDKIGDAGKRLHTGRSRNDQVATDIRLYARDAIDLITSQAVRLQHGMLELAERNANVIMPGFTHLQTAQPVTFGHHVMAWFEMVSRDVERFRDCAKRVNVMPLGAAALAGTPYPIDREHTRETLGFTSVAANSLDAVSDRDFAIELCAASAITMTHLSRMAEELVLWSSAQFDFIDLPDRFCTGSSIMPQKKNPDIAELVRGKSARVIGNLQALLVLMKSQPLAYNRDNQEDKEPTFDTVDTLVASLQVFAAMIPSIRFNQKNLYQAALQGYATATDLAEYLVRLNVPFRDAHEIVGNTVHYAIENSKPLSDLSLTELQSFGAMIKDDVYDVLTLEGSINARDHIGGTAPKQVQQALQEAKQRLAKATS